MKTAIDQPRKRTTKPAAERRQEIIDAAFKLFRQEGFVETTVGDIAKEAGVATGTVYLYFPSKHHVLVALHEQFHDGMAESIGKIAVAAVESRSRGEETDQKATIDAIVDAIANYCLANRESVEVCFRHLPEWAVTSELGRVDRHFIEFLAATFETANSEGIIHTSDPQMLAYMLNSALGVPIGTCLAFGDPPDLDRLIAAAKELLYKALSPLPDELTR